jgi:hypothetical protein
VLLGRAQAEEPVEVGRSREGIDRRGTADTVVMPAMIVQYVDERTPHFERRCERPRVIAVRKNGATTAMVAIHAPPDAHTEALHGT